MHCFILAYIEPPNDLPNWLVALVFATPLTVGLAIYFYKTRHAKTWRNGVFPISVKPTEDNMLEAYLALAARLMQVDYAANREKIQYINTYFAKYFQFAHYNFGDSLAFSMRHPIKIESVLEWIKLHQKEQKERINLLYFLTGLTWIKRNPTKNEIAFLTVICDQLEVPTSELERLLKIYEYYQANKKEETKSEKSSRNKVQEYYGLLGVEQSASLEEIKLAYKKLVKLHHPDRFNNESEYQQKLAHDKFIAIQEAYDYLQKNSDLN